MIEWDRKSSLVDENIRHWRALEMAGEASSSVSTCGESSTTRGANVCVGNIEVCQIDYPGGSRKPNPPVCC